MAEDNFMEDMYLEAIKMLRTLVFEIDYEKNRKYCSPMFQECFGIESVDKFDFMEDEQLGKIVYPDDVELYHTLFLSRRGERSVTCRFVHLDGKSHWYRVVIKFINNEDGSLRRVIGTMKDVSDEIRSSAELKYHRDYDSLTGAPNYEKFISDVTRKLTWDNGHKHALITFDVQQLKLINDLHGMRSGDLVLIHVADVLSHMVPEPNNYCRMHSDFFCLCIDYETKGEIIRFIEKLRKAIDNKKFEYEIRTVYGVYLPKEGEEIAVNLMCDRATLAKKSIKDNAIQFCAFYDEEYRNQIVRKNAIESEMEQALAEHQFVMYLQPKVNLEKGELIGAEVLARWQHPTKGLIPPDEFIPLFEKNGFILKLDEYMWEEACKAIQAWHEAGRKKFPVSVNVSRYHIHNHRIENILRDLLRKYELDPKDLSLEITETMFFDKAKELYDLLERLQHMGFTLEVDDFGAGYSSLNMLRNIPADIIKIDKSFLDDTLTSEKGKIVIRHTIAMAKELNLHIIAEGVETLEHVEFLKDSQCDYAQGYYFAKPMPLAEFNKLNF